MNTSRKCVKFIQSGLEKDSHSLQFLVDLKVGSSSYTLIPEVIEGKKKSFLNGISNSALIKGQVIDDF